MRVQKSERAREWDWFDVVHLNRQCVMPFISNNFLFRGINYILSLVVWSDRNFKIGDETDEMRYMHAKNRCTNILATVSAQWVQLRHIKCALLLVSLANLLIDTNKLVLPHKFSITDSRHCIDVFAQISIFICSIEACFRASVLPCFQFHSFHFSNRRCAASDSMPLKISVDWISRQTPLTSSVEWLVQVFIISKQ